MDARRRGFTLIEMLAVVALFAMITGIVVPNLGFQQFSELRDQAERMALDLEFARQSAVMRGAPHRMLINLDDSSFRIEWKPPPETEEIDEGALVEDEDSYYYDEIEIALSAPATTERDFEPVPNHFGKSQRLDDGIFFDFIESDLERVDSGTVEIPFERDGTTEHTEVFLVHEAGYRIRLELLPLADTVRIYDDEV